MGRGWPDVCFKSSPAAELKQRYNLGLVELPQSSCRRFGQRRTKGSGVLDTALASAPESSLAWLDFDRAASERLSELLRALDEPGTLDVLGLGTVRDAFSAMLNPGTSTTQTRLRYFIFIPWIFAKLEQEQVLAAEFSRRLRDYESRLMDCLRHLGRNQGVIGYAAGRNLKRMPSDAYWGGLRAWGLRRLDLSISEFGQYAASLARSRPERNDDDEAMTRGVSMWAALPPAPDDFLHADITFDLAPTEAQVLVEHIRQHHQGSLLAVLCAVPETAKDAEYPWELPTHAMPGQLVEVLRNARNFSELTAGPQHVYNLLLARRTHRTRRPEPPPTPRRPPTSRRATTRPPPKPTANMTATNRPPMRLEKTGNLARRVRCTSVGATQVNERVGNERGGVGSCSWRISWS